MKRKYLSVFNAVLSIAVGLTFLVLAGVLLVRALNAKEYIPVADGDLWLIRVLQRLKAAGFNIFFSIMGIILTVVLSIYRFTLAYFYFKVSKSEGVLYKERLVEIIFFSVLAGFVVGVTAWFSFGGKGILPVEIHPFIVVLFLAYILLCSLPIVEIAIVYLSTLIKRGPKQEVPSREGIIEELDELADKTAMEIAQKQQEKEVAVEPAPEIKQVVPVKQEVIAPAKPVRKVVECQSTCWDSLEDCKQEISVDIAKQAVNKMNKKLSYNSATLRIKKPINNKMRLKNMSPVKINLRYHKDCRLACYKEDDRK